MYSFHARPRQRKDRSQTSARDPYFLPPSYVGKLHPVNLEVFSLAETHEDYRTCMGAMNVASPGSCGKCSYFLFCVDASER